MARDNGLAAVPAEHPDAGCCHVATQVLLEEGVLVHAECVGVGRVGGWGVRRKR